MKEKLSMIGIICAWVFGIAFILALIAVPISVPYWNEQTYTVSELLVVQDNDKTLFNVTTDTGEELIFENEDLLFIGKTNSSNFTIELKKLEGKCHLKITTRGYRISLLSSYQNIVKFEALN